MSWVFVVMVDQEITFRRAVENQIQLSPKAADRIDKMPPADRERTMQQQTTVTRFISYGYPAVILVWNALIAAILFAAFKVGFSADINFKRAYAIVMYGSLPVAIKTVLAIIADGGREPRFYFPKSSGYEPGLLPECGRKPCALLLGNRTGYIHDLDPGGYRNWLFDQHQNQARDLVGFGLRLVHSICTGQHCNWCCILVKF